MLNQVIIPNQTITFIGTAATLCFALPLLLLAAYKKNTKASVRPCVYGIVMYLAFAMGLEQIAHMIFLVFDSPVSRFINSHTWAYAVYGGLAAGIFEETARFIAFRMLKNEHSDKTVPIMYGIGHGGAEAILIGAISLLNLMMVALNVNAMGSAAFLESMGEAAAGIRPTIDSLFTTPAAMYFVSVLERITSLVLQISLSVLVFFSVMKRELRLLFPASIGLHALVDIFAVLYQTDIITNLWLLEGIVVVYTAAVAFLAFRTYRKYAEA